MILSISLPGCISASSIPKQVTSHDFCVYSIAFMYSFITQVFIQKQLLFTFQKLSYKGRLNAVWRVYYCYLWIKASRSRYKQNSF